MKVWTLLLRMDECYDVSVHASEDGARQRLADECLASWNATEGAGEPPVDRNAAIDAWFWLDASQGGNDWAEIQDTEFVR